MQVSSQFVNVSVRGFIKHCERVQHMCLVLTRTELLFLCCTHSAGLALCQMYFAPIVTYKPLEARRMYTLGCSL